MSEKNQNNVENNEISIELTEEVAEGVYANLAIINHSNTEFVLDFVRVVPGVPKAKVKSRIILTPENAARLHGALQENLARFEAQIKAQVNAAAANQSANQAPEQPVSKDFPYPIDFKSKGEA